MLRKKDQNYRIVMLGSGTGTTIDYFCEKAQSQELKAQVVALISDRKEIGVEKVAKKHQIPFHIIEYKKEKLEEWSENLLKIISSYNPHLILLAGFLRKIPSSLLSHFTNSVINSHPSLLPEFSGCGMYGLRVHEAVIQNQKKQTGVSIHLVNENWDEGPVLSQKSLAVLSHETALELQERVKKMEKEFYLATVSKIISKEIVLNEF